MKKSTIFVGLDVHKNSIEVAFADSGRDSEVRSPHRQTGTYFVLE
ncbi:MAG: hypothetical protein QNK24_02470 [Desulfuromusa sp.]|nr:hypothetical protein [Desulfuromusa sp.]